MKNNLLCEKQEASFRDKIVEHGVLLAVSGGADSMALLHLASQLIESDLSSRKWHENRRTKLGVAHINHRLRGTDSDDDANFVREMAELHHLPYFEHVISPTEWATDQSGSIEGAARKIRYDFLTSTAEKSSLRYVATAHTANDQVETILHRIIRGTGLVGLCGIPAFRVQNDAVTFIRPLLEIKREAIIDYLLSISAEYRVDSTNLENKFTRNQIRNELLPHLRTEFNPNVDESLVKLAILAGEQTTVLNELIEIIFLQMIIRETKSDTISEVVLDLNSLLQLSGATRREIFVRLWKRKNWPLREMGFDEWNRLSNWIESSLNPKDQSARRLELPGFIIAVKESTGSLLFRLKYPFE
ncbi:MAG: tRNA lysidine(34) synthetase TilS [Thermoguttaceae bacterium]